MSKKSKDTSSSEPDYATSETVYDPEPAPEPAAHEPSLEGRKLAAVAAAIRHLAAGSGADVHFTEAGCQQWASRILEAIELIENPPPPPVEEAPAHAEEHAYEEESAR